ncbi:DUF2194 domain-containing protein [Robiginitalea sp. IMCC43444]|uniref:DUF2194 domain-containing protein n=1 Tax=Robiginitalea sp. IMCC43444 TaxID=3459121 RepID=UPI0040417BFB
MKYLIRLDDACETMNWEKWLKMESLLDKYNIKPLISVIPNNEDPSMQIDSFNAGFWNWVLQLKEKGWEIGLHGYNHVYSTNCGGINPLHNRSEFAGHPINIQKDKIRKGFRIFMENGLEPRIFVAPSHTFDYNTLNALKEESSIRIISDTIAFRPYRKGDFSFIPVQFGHVRNINFPIGIITFCYHPNTMTKEHFEELDNFIEINQNKFLAFPDTIGKFDKKKSIMDILYSKTYFLYRKYFR